MQEIFAVCQGSLAFVDYYSPVKPVLFLASAGFLHPCVCVRERDLNDDDCICKMHLMPVEKCVLRHLHEFKRLEPAC